MREGEFFTVMSDRHTAALILALHEMDGPIVMKELQKITNHTQTLRQRSDRMEEEGIVDIAITYEPHKFVKVFLNGTGKEIAMLVSTMDSLIPGGGIEKKSINMRYADPIMRMLRGKEYVVQKDIKNVMPYYDSITKVLGKMADEKLVVRKESDEGYREIRYTLTSKGGQVADAFESIYRKITGRT